MGCETIFNLTIVEQSSTHGCRIELNVCFHYYFIFSPSTTYHNVLLWSVAVAVATTKNHLNRCAYRKLSKVVAEDTIIVSVSRYVPESNERWNGRNLK